MTGTVFSWNVFKHWKRLNLHGPVLLWFNFSVRFLSGVVFFSSVCLSSVDGYALSDVLQSHDFGVVCNALLNTEAAVSLSVYVDKSLDNLGTVDIKAGATAFFENIYLGLGIKVSGLVSLTMTELQTIALVLEYISPFCSVDLFLDSQVALDTCEFESSLICPDFRNWCWIECHHIADVSQTISKPMHLLKQQLILFGRLFHKIGKCFLKGGGSVISGNSRHFVYDIGSGSQVIVGSLHDDINWSRSSLVWHPDSHMAAGSINACIAGLWTYFMKALHHQLLVAVCKHLYDKCYPSVVCLFCNNVEVSDHVFSCSFDAAGCFHLMNTFRATWKLLSICVSDVMTSAALYKGFVFKDWYHEFVPTFKDPKMAVMNVVNFVCNFCIAFWDDIWLVYVKHHAVMEKNRLIPHDCFIPVSVPGLSERLLSGVVRLLGVNKAFGISFKFHKSCLFFSGICDKVLVHIGV
ncbi:hypothetical protein G9A89_010957 [Geosiphon pyriformis]|nr:hypothetical protein G9A89_010957 [Geosiphon pyriformis]